MNQETYDEMFTKLHRASCMVGLVAERQLENDEPLTGETLKAAEDLILAAIDTLREQQGDKP